MAVLTICLGASVVLLLIERQKTSQFADELADLDRRTAATNAELQQQISESQARAESLDNALKQAREQLGRNDDRHRMDEAAATDAATELRTARQKASDRLAETERRSAAQATELQHRLEAEQAKTAGLDRDLGEARRQLAQTDGLQRSAATSAQEAENSRQQAAALTDRLAETERRAAAETKQVQERFEAEHARASNLEVELADARLKLADAATSRAEPPPSDQRSSDLPSDAGSDRQPTGTPTLPPAPSSSTTEPPARATAPAPDLARSATMPTERSAAPPRLPPDDVPARIVLRYAQGSESAKARAQFVELLLQERGLHIEDHALPARGLSASKVTFYYKEDQGAAKTVADALARITGADAVQKLPMSLKSPPRPGTIEVTIAG